MPTLHPITIIESEPSTPRRSAPVRLRRINRAHETDHKLVKESVPSGSVKAAHGDQVMAHLLRTPEFAVMRRDSQRTTVAVLSCLIARADYATMTTRPGHTALAEAAGRSLRTVQRVMRRLEHWGLIGLVAGGRQACYATEGPDGERVNEAAVYVLAVPSCMALVKSENELVVDKDVAPPALGGSHLVEEELTHTRAREKTLSDAAPPRRSNSAASGDPTPPPPYRPELHWPPHRTAKTPVQRLAAASELRSRIFLLRPMSAKDIRSSLRDFFIAGWTIADIQHALEWLPNSNRWPHSSIPNLTHLNRRDAAVRLRGWLAYRLREWKTHNGETLYSPSQRAEADRRQQLTFQAIERKRILEEQAQRIAQVNQPASHEKTQALAAIHALKTHNRTHASGNR